MFFTERLLLRAIDQQADLNTFLQWRNTIEFARAWKFDNIQPASREEVKALFEKLAKSDPPAFAICLRPAAEALQLKPDDDYFLKDGASRFPMIGFLNLHHEHVSYSARVVDVGLAFEAEHQGKGLVTELMRWAMDFVFNNLALHRCELQVVAANERARRCYEKVGFVLEGVSRKAFFSNGAWMDIIRMAMLEEEWFEIKKRDGLPGWGFPDW